MMNEVQKQEVEEETFVYEVDDETSEPKQKSEIPKVESSEKERTIVREKTEEPEELEAYSDNVQKRINQLTAKRKQALEEADAAFNFAQQQKNENDQLKQQLSQLNQGYTSEFSNRIESQNAQAKKLFKEAFDAGDSDKMAEANDLMSRLAIENERLRIQKIRVEQAGAVEANARQNQKVERQPQQATQKQKLDPKLQNWLDGNSWFGTDMVMTRGAQAIHEQLVAGEGFDPTTDDYYNEVSRRMVTEFPHKFKGGQRNTQSVTPASNGRSMKRGGKKTIELTAGQVAFAKKMRIPLEKYAQEVAKIERSKGVA
jgi:multidrug efflux pump subunit AcrA (membrane-fusion protein)